MAPWPGPTITYVSMAGCMALERDIQTGEQLEVIVRQGLIEITGKL
jgi:hypothetical protein